MASEARSDVAFKPRNIVVLSDGTGNSAAKLFRTNVWRIYEALDLNCDDQVALYDNGVGTASFKPLAAIGGAFGFGLKRNVLDLYIFLCRNYEVAPDFDQAPGDPARHDRIFAFGFSRGAFTARVLASLVANQGLIWAAKNDRDLVRLARWAYREYRAQRYKTWFGVRFLRMLRNAAFRLKDALLRQKPYNPSKNRKVDINFLGVFDTVAAYGLPFDELTRGWDKWVWPMLPRDRSLNSRVKYARHAVAIDDERQTFFPLLWDEDSDTEKENNRKWGHAADRIKQVWFAGMHSNVGGGYADDDLSMGPLCWIAGEAAAHGLRFQAHRRPSGAPIPDEWVERAAPCAPMGDSRKGVGAYYRYHPRPIGRLCGYKDHSGERDPKSLVTIDRPKIHESVFERIRDARDSYAPFGLPERYVVVTRKGAILADDASPGNAAPNPFEHSTQAASRVLEQQGAWDTVWQRRVVYFATIGATLFLLALPLFPQAHVPAADSSSTLKMAIGVVGGFLPEFAQGFLGSYQDRPGLFFLTAAAIGLLLWYGAYLKGSINDRMLRVWADRNGLQVRELKDPAPLPGGWIYNLRESRPYKATFRFMSEKLWPNAFGLLILIILFGAIPVRLAYQVVSRTDSFCKPALTTPDFIPMAIGVDGSSRNAAEFWFHPTDICRLAGLKLQAGQKYAIQIAIPVDPVEEGKATAGEASSCRNLVTEESQKKWVGGWKDLTIPVASTAGIESSGLMGLFLPFRRIWGADWFVPIAAIGTKIPERHYLTDPAMDFTTTRTGMLSLYVNDAAFPIGPLDGGVCTGWDCYYRNNVGGPARVRVTQIDANMTAKSLLPLTPFTCEEQKARAPSR
jgi:uncharacterized protein (DUF2235 family)